MRAHLHFQRFPPCRRCRTQAGGLSCPQAAPLNTPAPESVSSPAHTLSFLLGHSHLFSFHYFCPWLLSGEEFTSLTIFSFFFLYCQILIIQNTMVILFTVLDFFFFFGICIFHKREVRGCSPLMWSRKPRAGEEGGSWSEARLSGGEEPRLC